MPRGVPKAGFRMTKNKMATLGLVNKTQELVQPESKFTDRKSTRLNSSHVSESRMPSSA